MFMTVSIAFGLLTRFATGFDRRFARLLRPIQSSPMSVSVSSVPHTAGSSVLAVKPGAADTVIVGVVLVVVVVTTVVVVVAAEHD